MNKISLDILEKIFQNLEMPLGKEEATQKAHLFFETALGKFDWDMINDTFEDYWIQIAKNWDLNIYDGAVFSGDNRYHIVLYPVKENETDILSDVDITEAYYNKSLLGLTP